MFDEKILQFLTESEDVKMLIAMCFTLPFMFSLVTFTIDRIVRLLTKGNVL